MNQSADLLFELGTEELPPKALSRLAEALCRALVNGLNEAFPGQPFTTDTFATPRRLAVRLRDVPARQPNQPIDKQGPAVAAAFDDSGQPTRAAQGFARSCGVAVDQLEQRDTNKGKRLAFSGTEPGKTLAALFAPIVTDALKRLPIPRRMRWGDSDTPFIRPVHWVVAMHGRDVLPLTLFGQVAGQTTYGHRFHHPQPIKLDSPDDYELRLYEPGHVIADFSQRRALVNDQIRHAATALGGEAIIHADLLDEVSALVEWPVAISGSFDSTFLQLPSEVLIATLEGHQRYFTVADDNNDLLACFITIANLDSRDPVCVVTGNERVIRPRLADALFFWNTDRKHGLQGYARELASVTFQKGLGSLADKTARLSTLSSWLAGQLDGNIAAVQQSAALAKADLLTAMVGEFPELQGTMGRYYAADVSADVAGALEQQYAPRHAGEAIPGTPTGRILSLADRLDTLAGIFSLGKRPSGTKDPFALRRNALAVVRIVIEAELDLDLRQVLAQAVALQPNVQDQDSLIDDLLGFHYDRLRTYYAERGITPEVFQAVEAMQLTNLLDFEYRVQAVRDFLANTSARQLCGAHKRIRNILKGRQTRSTVDESLLCESAERQLFSQLVAVRTDLEPLLGHNNYPAALHRLAQLQQPVDLFFDEVMVMSDNQAIRDNRLALLALLDNACQGIADLSRLSPQQ